MQTLEFRFVYISNNFSLLVKSSEEKTFFCEEDMPNSAWGWSCQGKNSVNEMYLLWYNSIEMQEKKERKETSSVLSNT
jgi:hypothetical protein